MKTAKRSLRLLAKRWSSAKLSLPPVLLFPFWLVRHQPPRRHLNVVVVVLWNPKIARLLWQRRRGPNNIIAKNCSLWKNIYIALRIFVGSNQLIVLQMWKNSGIGIGILVSSNQLIAIFLLTSKIPRNVPKIPWVTKTYTLIQNTIIPNYLYREKCKSTYF